jgi:hypothetical protein
VPSAPPQRRGRGEPSLARVARRHGDQSVVDRGPENRRQLAVDDHDGRRGQIETGHPCLDLARADRADLAAADVGRRWQSRKLRMLCTVDPRCGWEAAHCSATSPNRTRPALASVNTPVAFECSVLVMNRSASTLRSKVLVRLTPSGVR